MTDLDLTPVGLRKLAQECVTPDTSAFAVLLECSRTLRALADQMEAYAPTNFDNPPGNWAEKAAEGAAAIVKKLGEKNGRR